MRRIDNHNHIGVELISYLRSDFPYAQMLPQLVSDGTAAGITDWIVFPMVTNLSLGIEGMRRGEVTTFGALDSVPYAWENQRLLQEVYLLFPQQADHIFPLVMADPLRRPAEQVAALRHLRTEHPDWRFYGIKIQSTILQAPIKELLGAGRVLLDLSEEWDLPLLIHSSVHSDDPWAQASDILDIAEAHPQIRFCVAHSCRFDKPCLDRLATLPNTWFDCSAHGIHCEIAVRDWPQVAPPSRRFPTDYTRPEIVLRDLAGAYPDHLIWGSDSPYYSFADQASGLSLFSTYAAEAACLDFLQEDIQRKVSWDNTLRCFSLPIEKREATA